jgi:hypothetical protein
MKRSILRRLLTRILPRRIDASLEVLLTLWGRYGYGRAFLERSSVNAKGEPIPWISYPALEYLSQLDLRQKDLFEFGSGNSTRYWAKRCRTVTSVEHDPEWANRVRPSLSENCKLFQATTPKDYVGRLGASTRRYDIIVVDGEFRPDCVKVALKRLKPAGMILLDNSNWYPKSAARMRQAGLLEVDFYGFGPLSDFVTSTSLFFDRRFKVVPIHGLQPSPGIAAPVGLQEP